MTAMRAIVAESADHLVWAEVPDVVPDHGDLVWSLDSWIAGRRPSPPVAMPSGSCEPSRS